MQAVVLDRYGPPDVLHCSEIPKPEPAQGQVLIRVQAAGVNPIDWRIRNGSLRWLLPARFPLVLGFDVSGTVEQIGGGVRGVQPGEEVFCHLDVLRHGGGYAEFALASATVLAPKPEGISHEEAAGVPLAACTALQALRDLGGIATGKRVLVNGASGGVGSFAVQIAVTLGASVTGVCSGRSAEFVNSLGAADVVDYTAHDFTRRQESYDIVFDAVAKSSLPACRRILKPGGVYIRTVPNITHLLCAGLTRMLGRRKAKTVWVHPSGGDLQTIKQWIDEGKVRSLVEQCIPLCDARRAHQLSEAGHVRGKLVLRIVSPA